ncbi:response regulator [Oceanobacillus caeni]|uniref:Transcriptional regulator n=1 Tax=Oceanobacillus caeni TaxID=405946 RepID=A0ABR5MIJ4_9BACI|nr:response regulator [Oceanobacillus caeni]KKE77626.1 transcriptional regulator [Bacilli bacterium VT-13-104]PZD83891.1 response regulator [Bacilli bacterium]KPH74306.1 transcriptional regulator [Oceanobacillus caeni]MBU8791408.1 response regulator [Oceanobacillus caeni]MCR1833770.1 response regulator [Oceanobacillus caeni]
MSQNFSVLIVEDDFRVAEIHRQYVEKVNGFKVMDTVNSGKDALHFLKNTKCLPDLILLDIYIPDVEGVNLFWEIRKTYHEIDIIVVTAAKEVETIQETFRGGIFDFIVKPFDNIRFEQTLLRYKDFRQQLELNKELSQKEIDRIIGFQELPNSATITTTNLPKGIDSITLNEINRLFKEKNIEGITAVELSKQIGTSRSTARRYLEYLVSINKIETKLIYGSVGRPERRYILRETYEQNE